MIFGLLDQFPMNRRPRAKCSRSFELLNAFNEMKSAGISLLLVCTERKVAPERNKLFTTLKVMLIVSDTKTRQGFSSINSAAQRMLLHAYSVATETKLWDERYQPSPT